MSTDTHTFGRGVMGNPPKNFAAITPSDSADLGYVTTCLYCASNGVIYVDGQESGTNVPVPMAVGCNPGRFTRVYSTGLSVAGTIVAGW